VDPEKTPHTGLVRGIGLWQAAALNVTLIIGAGVFVSIPGMLGHLPGPYAVLAWVAAGVLILIDSLIWGELGAALPRSGGSYHFLLESYGRDQWGRPMSFLYIWQFLLSGPLELGSGLVSIALFSASLTPGFAEYNAVHTVRWVIWEGQNVAVSVGPARWIGFGVGVLIIALLFRRITTLGRLTVAVWLGVLAACTWILVEGALRFSPDRAFDVAGVSPPGDFGWELGAAMVLAIYSYLGYYNVCHVGDEVRDPGRVVPRAIIISAAVVVVLFVALHLAMLGTVSWRDVPTDDDNYSLPAAFMAHCHGPWAVTLVTLLLIGSCFGSCFAGMLGYSRVPYGAAREGHFFAAFARVHPRLQIPHVSILLIGVMTLFWSFFDLQNVINALITTRLLEQFVGQAVGVMLLRKYRPDLYRPFKMWLYPLPCLLALAGWLYLYVSAGWVYVALGAATLATGAVVFLAWSWRSRGWPWVR
jgi:amino acid transporter